MAALDDDCVEGDCDVLYLASSSTESCPPSQQKNVIQFYSSSTLNVTIPLTNNLNILFPKPYQKQVTYNSKIIIVNDQGASIKPIEVDMSKGDCNTISFDDIISTPKIVITGSQINTDGLGTSFFDIIPSNVLETSTTTSKGGLKTGEIVAIAVAGAVFIGIISIILIKLIRKKKSQVISEA